MSHDQQSADLLATWSRSTPGDYYARAADRVRAAQRALEDAEAADATEAELNRLREALYRAGETGD